MQHRTRPCVSHTGNFLMPVKIYVRYCNKTNANNRRVSFYRYFLMVGTIPGNSRPLDKHVKQWEDVL